MARLVPVGSVLGAFGVQGWLKVKSDTEPPENILRYSPWYIGEREFRVLDGKQHGPGVVARLEGITDRDQAAGLRGSEIAVPRYLFPPLPKGEYYWTDLVGLEVRTLNGTVLGTLANMLETGANDVMEVRGERVRLIPFLTGTVVTEVQPEDGFLMVDWDPEF